MNNSLESLDSLDTEKMNTGCEIVRSILVEKTVVKFEETLQSGTTSEDTILAKTLLSKKRRYIGESDSERIKPIIKVTFRNSNDFINYCHKIEQFLKDLVQPKHGKINVKSSAQNLNLEVFESSSSCTNISNAKSNNNGKEKQPNDAFFTVDTKDNLKDELDVYRYKKTLNKALKTPSDQIEVKDDFTSKMTCLNFLGNHSFGYCEMLLNPVAIIKNRRDYKAKKGSSSAMYYLDGDQSCKQVENDYKKRKFLNFANTKPWTDVNPRKMDNDEVEDIPVQCVPVKNLLISSIPKEDSSNTSFSPPSEDDEIVSTFEDASMNSNAARYQKMRVMSAQCSTMSATTTAAAISPTDVPVPGSSSAAVNAVNEIARPARLKAPHAGKPSRNMNTLPTVKRQLPGGEEVEVPVEMT